MVKYHFDWNSCIEAWESDGRVFKEPAPRKVPLMEVFALDFLHFGAGRDRALLRGKVSVIHHGGDHEQTVYSSGRFRTFRPGRFDALMWGNFIHGGVRPIDAEYDVDIRVELEDKNHGVLFLQDPFTYKSLQNLGPEYLKRGQRPSDDDIELWITFPHGHTTYDCLCKTQLVGPHCAVDVLSAVYRDAVAATVELSFVASKNHFNPDVWADFHGKVTARNTLLTDPEAYSTLFARTTYDYAKLRLGDSLPLLKPSVVLPAKSSLVLDLDLEYRVPGKRGSNHKFLKTKSSFLVPASQGFQSFVDITSPGDASGPAVFALLKVKIIWSKY